MRFCSRSRFSSAASGFSSLPPRPPPPPFGFCSSASLALFSSSSNAARTRAARSLPTESVSRARAALPARVACRNALPLLLMRGVPSSARSTRPIDSSSVVWSSVRLPGLSGSPNDTSAPSSSRSTPSCSPIFAMFSACSFCRSIVRSFFFSSRLLSGVASRLEQLTNRPSRARHSSPAMRSITSPPPLPPLFGFGPLMRDANRICALTADRLRVLFG